MDNFSIAKILINTNNNAWHARGHRFDSDILHLLKLNRLKRAIFCLYKLLLYHFTHLLRNYTNRVLSGR
jgi:hypothetical protein